MVQNLVAKKLNIGVLIMVTKGVQSPAVSWLLCAHVFNSHVIAAMDSCFNQTVTDFECIVVVNGEESKTVHSKILERYGFDRRLRLFDTSIRHLTFSLSLGLHKARSPLIARMDSDDISSPDRLQKQINFLNLNKEVAVVGSSYDVIDGSSNRVSSKIMPTTDKEIRRLLHYKNPLCHPSVMFRRQVALECGGYLGDMYSQDYDLWVKIATRTKYKFANLQDVCLSYRKSGIGNARGSRLSYAAMGGIQFNLLLNGSGWRWGAGAAISACKSFVQPFL
jgi:hypothetical protein